MQIKHIEKCLNPPAFFGNKLVYRATLADDHGMITQYIGADSEQDAKERAKKACDEYHKRQNYDVMNLTSSTRPRGGL